MTSYESSKWYIKLWRHRWYLYAVLLYIKDCMRTELWIDYMTKFLLNENLDDDEREKLRLNWKQIKKHVELSKMYKFSAK